MTLSLDRIIILGCGYLIIIFCLLPYISIIGLNTDAQPNALFFSILLHFLIWKKKVPIFIYYSYFILIISTIILFYSGLNFLNFRDWANYFSLAIITSAVYLFLNYIEGDYYNLFKIITYSWLICGLTQYFIYPRFLDFLVSRTNGSLVRGRGVTGFSPEPTFYGLTMLSFLIIYTMENWIKKDILLGFCICFQILFLSRSSTAVVAILLSVFLFIFYLFLNLNLRVIVLILLSTIFLFIVLNFFKSYFIETRLYTVYLLLSQNPLIIISIDYSVSERLNHLIFPFIGSFENYFIPNGFGAFQNYIVEKSQSNFYRLFFIHPSFSVSTRTMNGYGKAFFELGIFGALIPVIIYFQVKKSLNTYFTTFMYILFNIILCMSFVFTTAIVPFMIACMLHRSVKNIKESYV